MFTDPDVPPSNMNDAELPLQSIIRFLKRNWRVLVLAGMACAIVGAGVAIVQPRVYEVDASFVSNDSGQGNLGGLAGLAGQLGVEVPGADEGRSPQFYAFMITSREVLRPVLQRLRTSDGVDLLEHSKFKDSDGEARVRAAVEWARSGPVSAMVRRETGMVAYTVRTPWPEISAALAEELIVEVQRFDLDSRNTQARAERQFLEDRLRSAEDELDSAESLLLAFLTQNRRIDNSAELLFRNQQLEERVARRRQVVLGLAQAYEQARVQEVRNTPLITVIEYPELPLQPVRQPMVLFAFLGAVLGLLISCSWRLAHETLKRSEGV